MDGKLLNLLYQLSEVRDHHAVVKDNRLLADLLPEGDDKARLTAALDDLEKNLAVDAHAIAAKFKYEVPPKPIKPVLAVVAGKSAPPSPLLILDQEPEPAPAADLTYWQGVKDRIFNSA